MRYALTIALMMLLTAQSVLHAAQPAAVPEMGQFVRGLQPGTMIALRLADGSRVRGMLVTVGEDEVTVRPRTRIPEPLRHVPIASIADAELTRGRGAAKTMAAAAAVGAGAALGFLFLLAAIYAD